MYSMKALFTTLQYAVLLIMLPQWNYCISSSKVLLTTANAFSFHKKKLVLGGEAKPMKFRDYWQL